MGYPGHPSHGGYQGPPHGGSGGWGVPPPPPPHGGPPPFGAPHRPPPASMTSPLISLVCNLFALCFLGLFALVGAALAGIALGIHQSHPQASRVLAVISWVVFGLEVLLGIVLFALYGYVLFTELALADY